MTNRSLLNFKIRCPFCDALLVEDFDSTEVQEDRIEEMPDPVWNLDCPHVAAHRVWGYVEGEIHPDWNVEVLELISAFEREEEGLGDLDTLLDFLSEDIDTGSRWVNKLLPNIECSLVNKYLEKCAGPNEGGPTFTILLLRIAGDKHEC